ncbi:hypothetical protein QV65_32125 [Rhodococcus erythropolis]|nr:hypothetical protein QV65_32125 [Rhodococcus erythropolis]
MEVVGAAIEFVDGPSSLMQLPNIASTNTAPSPQPSFCFVVAMNLSTAAMPVTEARRIIDDPASGISDSAVGLLQRREAGERRDA